MSLRCFLPYIRHVIHFVLIDMLIGLVSNLPVHQMRVADNVDSVRSVRTRARRATVPNIQIENSVWRVQR